MSPIAHPLTGEVLPDDLDALERAEVIVDNYLRTQAKHYKFRAALRAEIARQRGKAELPRPRWRSEVQQKVAECPRCGTAEWAA